MSIIDGGTYKCGNHDREFVTEDSDEWKKHLESHIETGDLVKSGSGICIVCNRVVTFENVPHHMNPMHDECKQALISGSNNSNANTNSLDRTATNKK